MKSFLNYIIEAEELTKQVIAIVKQSKFKPEVDTKRSKGKNLVLKTPPKDRLDALMDIQRLLQSNNIEVKYIDSSMFRKSSVGGLIVGDDELDIVMKPSGKTASKTTDLQEAGVAITTAYRMYVDKKVNNVNEMDMIQVKSLQGRGYELKESMTPEEVIAFMESDPSWHNAIMDMSKEIASKILKGKWIISHQGPLMESVYKQAMTLLKEDGQPTNADKWNPGDIWAFKAGMSVPVFNNIWDMNEYINGMTDIIALSLKKGEGAARFGKFSMGNVLKHVNKGLSPKDIKPSGSKRSQQEDEFSKEFVSAYNNLRAQGIKVEATFSIKSGVRKGIETLSASDIKYAKVMDRLSMIPEENWLAKNWDAKIQAMKFFNLVTNMAKNPKEALEFLGLGAASELPISSNYYIVKGAKSKLINKAKDIPDMTPKKVEITLSPGMSTYLYFAGGKKMDIRAFSSFGAITGEFVKK